MADATLTDVVKKLEEVKSAVKAGEVATGAERIAASEAAAEAARTDAKRMGIFQAISDKPVSYTHLTLPTNREV